jgi:hypothetical protein
MSLLLPRQLHADAAADLVLVECPADAAAHGQAVARREDIHAEYAVVLTV